MMELAFGILRRLAMWLFWPGLLVVVWGEVLRDPHASPYFWDKGEHFIAYFGLAAMATLVIERRRALFWALAGIIAFGGVLEIVQSLVGRDASVGDFIANTLGALAGLGVALAMIRLATRKLLVARGRNE